MEGIEVVYYTCIFAERLTFAMLLIDVLSFHNLDGVASAIEFLIYKILNVEIWLLDDTRARSCSSNGVLE